MACTIAIRTACARSRGLQSDAEQGLRRGHRGEGFNGRTLCETGASTGRTAFADQKFLRGNYSHGTRRILCRDPARILCSARPGECCGRKEGREPMREREHKARPCICLPKSPSLSPSPPSLSPPVSISTADSFVKASGIRRTPAGRRGPRHRLGPALTGRRRRRRPSRRRRRC
jgi:hypothetical protein